MAMSTVTSRRHNLYLLLAVLAGLKSLLTVVTAVLTWLTIWHFSATPFPLFYGWTFALVFLTVGSAKAVACSSPTTRLIQQLWRWGRCLDRSDSTDSSILAIPNAPVKPPDNGDKLPQYIQPPGTISTQQHNQSSSCCQLAARLFRLIAAIAALLALFAACMVIHGGAVLADWHLARCYLARRSAISTQEQRQARQLLRDAQQSATECSVTLALCFVAPSVAIKWGLAVFLGDMSWLPVLSTVLSSISYAAILSNFLATTFIYGTGWSKKQRFLGIAAVAAAVLAQFLWRLAARSFLVLKFGGEVFFFYVIAQHLQIVIGVLARSKDSRQTYKESFAKNRVQVFLLTLHGSALAYDFPAFFQGLKARQAASRADWLKRLMFGHSTLGMLAWRIIEGVAFYIVILTVHPLLPCDSLTAPEVSWYQVCAAEVAKKSYIWRSKCWGCSMYDMYALQQMHGGPLIALYMLLAAGLVLVLLLCGLLVLQRLLSGYISRQLAIGTHISGGAGSHGRHQSPVEKIVQQHPLDESEYAYALHGVGVVDSTSVASSASTAAQSSGAYLLPSVGWFGQAGHQLDAQQTAVDSIGCQSADTVQAARPDTLQHPSKESVNSINLVHPHGMADGMNHKDILHPVASESVFGVSPYYSSKKVTSDSSSQVLMMSKSQTGNLSLNPNEACNSLCAAPSGLNNAVSSIKNPSQTASSSTAANKAESVSGSRLLLRALAMLWLVVVCDIVVFNCHWLLQTCVLVIGVLYCLWVHVEFLFRSGDSPARSVR